MSPTFPFMPVDKSTIKTRLRLHPDLWTDPKAFVAARDIEVRSITPREKALHLDLLAYAGIKVKLKVAHDDGLSKATIDFNPGACVHGHNGRIVWLTDFLAALALLQKHVSPLLMDPADSIDLVPGLREGGHAYWSDIEVQFQFRDSMGKLLAGLRQLSHPEIRKDYRHWPTSIKVGPRRGALKLSIYQKAPQLAARGKLTQARVEEDGDILRLEMKAKGKKLTEYFNNPRNIERIGGKERLVRFYPEDLVQGHRACFGKLSGVYAEKDDGNTMAKTTQLAALGILLARLVKSGHANHTFKELLAQMRYHTGASATTIRKIKVGGHAELAQLSSISRNDLFSDAAYGAALSIACEEEEGKVGHEFTDTIPHPLIVAAYQPPDHFLPHVEFPAYERHGGAKPSTYEKEPL
jgi:hypothetical protein